ncbi:hypothetical protein BGZ60DRAFT_24318 [Tricladium varicosporioides]|nr:hypothetical protein BGZ60DRAFT_24318 [Hymenoscyphus varicosporioides]
MAAAGSPNGVPKAMSSRLLTMKFMQRAAASSPASSAPSTPDGPPSKRQRTAIDSSPTTAFDINALTDQRTIQKAVAEEEAKRQAALERQAAEAGDTRWVLSFEDQGNAAVSAALRVVPTGFAMIDSLSPLLIRPTEEESEDKPVMVGRRSFGKFNRVLERQQNSTNKESSESDSEDDDEDSESDSDNDSDDPTNALIKLSRHEATQKLKEERKAKKRAEKAKQLEMAKNRKKKDVNLNGLTSLSGKPAPNTSRGPCFNCGGPHIKSNCPELQNSSPSAAGACFNCGGPHIKSQCPKLKRSYSGGDDGPYRKLPRTR